MEHCSSLDLLDSPSRLMRLPKEVWTLVFSYLPQGDKLIHRLVNKEWCKNIDNFSTVDIKVHSTVPSRRALEQRIGSCTFSNLQFPFSLAFKFPLLVKEITFTTLVTASNVLGVLSVCVNIESLRFLTTLTSETSFEDYRSVASVLNNLNRLQFLEIGILTFLDRGTQQSKTFNSIVGNDYVLLPSLKTLRVAFTVRHVEWFQFFKFISRHSVTLKRLYTLCPCGERDKEEITVPKNLTFPQLDSLILNGSSDCACREDLLLLLDQQKQLRRFETDISRSTILEDLHGDNFSTLQTLKLYAVGTLSSGEFDCGVLRNFLALQELYLSFEWGCVIVVHVKGGTAQSRMPVLYNLEALPITLKRLTLCGTLILSSQLEDFFSDHRDLEEVILGPADTFRLETSGMTVKILISCLEKMKRLTKFRVFHDMISCLEEQIWLKLHVIANELGIDTNNNGLPYIDMVFENQHQKSEFISRLKETRKCIYVNDSKKM